MAFTLFNMLHIVPSLWTFIYLYFRPFVKWFLRKTTKLCELQRICYGEKRGGARSLGVHRSLTLSRSSDIQRLRMILDEKSDQQLFSLQRHDLIQYALRTVLIVKQIDVYIHPEFPKSFSRCIEHIWGYRQLVNDIEAIRKVPYNSETSEHEEKLLKLWSLLMPNQPLCSRVTKQWQEIGFQGDDPKTDFRGMGILGLDNLLYFAEEYPGPAMHVLSHSNHPRYGYAFAIVGINLTSMAYYLLKDGIAKTHIYNVSHGVPTIKLFHQLYCYLFYEFDRFWIEAKPRNVMDFSMIKQKFENSIRTALTNPETAFRINISVDNI